jgi:ribosomal protein S18 acetylase RimI-like enzyme
VSISIRDYSASDAEAVARMWNESGVGWPDGWSRVPASDDYWLDEIGQLDPLAIYLAIEDDRVVAYCELNEDSERGDVAWLDLINVHPAAWNRGVGRDLVRRAVALAVTRGYRRLDLSTWSGNFRAVPLYKKCGFCWRPDSAVHMENYLPLLHSVPVCAAFFARHDWYKSMRRTLAVTPDDEQRGQVRGYSYRWEADGDQLGVFVDRRIDGLAAVETNDFAVSASFDSEVLIAGQHGLAYVTLTNKTQVPLDVVLVARGHGLAGSCERRLQLRDTEHIEVPVRALAAESAAVPYVEAVIAIGGEFITLQSSVPVVPAISVATDPDTISLTPGSPQPMRLLLTNNGSVPLTLLAGALPVEPTQEGLAWLQLPPPEGLDVELPAQAVRLEPGRQEAVGCTLTAAYAGSFQTAPAIQVAYSGRALSIAAEPIAALAVGMGTPVAGRDAGYVRAENGVVRLWAAQKGGEVSLEDVVTGRPIFTHQLLLGPPYHPRDLDRQPFQMAWDAEGGAQVLTLESFSRRFPGLRVRWTISLDSSPRVRSEVTLENTSTKPIEVAVRTLTRNLLLGARFTLPLAGGPVDGLTADEFPDWQEPYLREPERLAEDWMAWNEPGGPGGGLCWSGMAEQAPADPRGFALVSPTHVLAPGGQLIMNPTYLIAGQVSARDVRQHWRRLFGSMAPAEMPAPQPPLAVRVTPPVLIAQGGNAQGQVTLVNHNSFSEHGTLDVHCPGWTATLESQGMRSDESNPSHQRLQLTADAAPGGAFYHAGQIVFHGRLTDVEGDFSLLALGEAAETTVVEERDSGGTRLLVTNGRLRFAVSPGFAAAVTELSLDGAEQLALAQSYPEPGSFSWTSPWYGGIHPAIRRWRPGDPSYPLDAGALHDSESTAEIVSRTGASGVAWRGVRVAKQGKEEGYDGLTQAVEYLTLPGAPLLAIVQELTNATTAPFPLQDVLSVFLRPWGQENGDVLYLRDGRLVRRHAAAFSFSAPEAHWSAVAVHLPSGEERAVVLVQGTAGHGVVTGVQFARMGPHLFGTLRVPVAPRAVRRTVRYLLFAGSVAEALRYRALAGLDILP